MVLQPALSLTIYVTWQEKKANKAKYGENDRDQQQITSQRKLNKSDESKIPKETKIYFQFDKKLSDFLFIKQCKNNPEISLNK